MNERAEHCNCQLQQMQVVYSGKLWTTRANINFSSHSGNPGSRPT